MQTGGRRGREGQAIGAALPGTVATLLPKLRKVGALRRFIELLPPEIAGLAAPHEIRLAPAAGGHSHDAPGQQVSTLFVYTASAVVSLIIEQRAAQLLAQLNAQLPYPLAEALRCEQAPPAKIAQQLNNLTLAPD